MFIEPIFETTITNQEADKTQLANTDFVTSLINFGKNNRSKFNESSAKKVLCFFKKLSIPTPENYNELLIGSEGILLFSNKLSLVIRIEAKKTRHLCHRINNSGYILKPISSINAEDIIIEVCPAIKLGATRQDVYKLSKKLKDTKIKYWDNKTHNTGIIPSATINFPEGVIVVTDRLAVREISGYTFRKKTVSENEAEKAQDELYSPLRKYFKETWNDKNKVPEFLSLCEEFKSKGKLIAGWNNSNNEYFKNEAAAKAAAQYDKKLSI